MTPPGQFWGHFLRNPFRNTVDSSKSVPEIFRVGSHPLSMDITGSEVPFQSQSILVLAFPVSFRYFGSPTLAVAIFLQAIASCRSIQMSRHYLSSVC